MSSAVAAARKRRAGIQSAPTMGPPPSQNQPVGQSFPQNGGAPPQTGLTLQQVINVINGRLLTLETAERERKERDASMPSAPVQQPNNASLSSAVLVADSSDPLQDDEMEIPIGEILSDYNQRFEILTQEISELKNLVLKLQSYTMDVNRTLLEDRFVIPATSEGIMETESNRVISEGSESEVDVADATTAAVVSDPLTIQVNGLEEPVIDAPLAPISANSTKKKGSSKNVSINI